MALDPDILIVIATLVAIFAFSTCVKGWVHQEWPWMAIISLGIGIVLLAYVHFALRPGGLTPRAIPDAFIHVLAMVLG